jgi:ferritin-like protein
LEVGSRKKEVGKRLSLTLLLGLIDGFMEEKKIKRILEEYKKETKRHFDVVAEKN